MPSPGTKFAVERGSNLCSFRFEVTELPHAVMGSAPRPQRTVGKTKWFYGSSTAMHLKEIVQPYELTRQRFGTALLLLIL